MLKEKDFIEIEYTARIKETGILVDTTSEETAKKENSFNKNYSYGPKVICLGQNQILSSLEHELIGKELNKTYKIELTPEKAFGKKNTKLIKTESINFLKQQNIDPFPGLQILDSYGRIITIRSVTGGRVIIDYNHPLAGRNLVYEIKVRKTITDNKEKIDCLISGFGLPRDAYELKVNSKVEIKLNKKYPENITKELSEKIKYLVDLEKICGLMKGKILLCLTKGGDVLNPIY